MNQTCCICGEEDEELFMFRIQTSRVRWMCSRCYKLAIREADRSEGMKRRARRKKKEDSN